MTRLAEYDVLIVGAGFAGSVLAERLAAGAGKRVLVVDRRSHVGGNAHDRLDAAGVMIHPYGPHIFHTNSQGVFDYLSRFTQWRPYEHRVLVQVGGQLLPMPINRQTINGFFGVALSESEVEPFLCAKAEPVGVPRTSADIVLGSVGREMYEAFFRGYTRKQWGLDPSELDKSVCSRVPVRTSDDDRYFLDRFQAMPLHGYTARIRADHLLQIQRKIVRRIADRGRDQNRVAREVNNRQQTWTARRGLRNCQRVLVRLRSRPHRVDRRDHRSVCVATPQHRRARDGQTSG